MTPDQLDKWSKKRAEEFADSFVNDDLQFKVIAAEHFSAGMAAAQEVYELVGRIGALKETFNETGMGESQWQHLKNKTTSAEAKLKPLLEGK